MAQSLKCAPGTWRHFWLLLQGCPSTCGNRWSRAASCPYGTSHFKNIIFNLKALSGCHCPRAHVPQVDIEEHLYKASFAKCCVSRKTITVPLDKALCFLRKRKRSGGWEMENRKPKGSETQAKHLEPDLSNTELW